MQATRKSLSSVLPWLFVAGTCGAEEAPESPSLQLQWDMRLRHEQVDNDAFARHARADTLRTRLGVLGQWRKWSVMLEGAATASADHHYNSGANGQIRYPAVNDPRGVEPNQGWVSWSDDAFGATVGRQRVTMDNQRWIGSGSWRQFEQTFNALALTWRPVADLTLRYAWLDRVHRTAGPDAINPLARARNLDTHLFHAAWIDGSQQWSGYAYLHEDKDVPTASSATYGVRWTGKPAGSAGLGWAWELAHQSPYANAPGRSDHLYWLAEPSWTQWGVTARLGWEHLGGDGRTALQTPLAAMHMFNGWDDQFTVTPAHGLDDRYLALQGQLPAMGSVRPMGWVFSWHDYRADRGGNRYGSEWNASLAIPLAKGLTGLMKVADYQASSFGRDDVKVWLQLEWRGLTDLLH